MKTGPDPQAITPINGVAQVVFLKNIITSPNIEVGDFTYVDDPEGKQDFESNVLYHFPFIGDKLIIGRFCAIAHKVTFVMNGANHPMSGLSTYPFYIFAKGWEASAPAPGELPYKGDTVIGHDVWIGYDATIMPGITIGSGAIIASKSVVTKDVPPYSIVAGNPAVIIKQRFEQATIDSLLQLSWWDWPLENITAALTAITRGDIQALGAFHAEK